MKAIFGWESNKFRTVCSLSGDYVRMGPTSNEAAAGIYEYTHYYQVSFFRSAANTLPDQLYREAHNKRFDTLNTAMAYVDNILEWAGYKTVPVEYKILL